MKISPKPGAKPGMRVKTHPNYFECSSEAGGWVTKSRWIGDPVGIFQKIIGLFSKNKPDHMIATNTPYRK